MLLTGKVDDLKGTLFNFNLATRAPQFFSWLNWATSGRTADLVVPTPFAMPDGEAATQVACGGAFSAVLLGASRYAALGPGSTGSAEGAGASSPAMLRLRVHSHPFPPLRVRPRRRAGEQPVRPAGRGAAHRVHHEPRRGADRGRAARSNGRRHCCRVPARARADKCVSAGVCAPSRACPHSSPVALQPPGSSGRGARRSPGSWGGRTS